MKSDEKSFFLECERHWLFWLLTFAGGFYGAYTFSVRGGVFCNAQTANVVLLGMAIGTGNVMKMLYLLVPISAYFLGTIISEILAKKIKRLHFLRWDTIMVGVEIIACVILGLIPKAWPDQICQVTLNFLCAMQFNTFRQNEGVPMATVFVTNHIRQTGSNLVKAIRDKDKAAAKRSRSHGMMLVMFLGGAILSAFLCVYFDVKSIFGVIPFLLFALVRLIIADRTYEKELLTKVPRGH